MPTELVVYDISPYSQYSLYTEFILSFSFQLSFVVVPDIQIVVRLHGHVKQEHSVCPSCQNTFSLSSHRVKPTLNISKLTTLAHGRRSDVCKFWRLPFNLRVSKLDVPKSKLHISRKARWAGNAASPLLWIWTFFLWIWRTRNCNLTCIPTFKQWSSTIFFIFYMTPRRSCDDPMTISTMMWTSSSCVQVELKPRLGGNTWGWETDPRIQGAES